MRCLRKSVLVFSVKERQTANILIISLKIELPCYVKVDLSFLLHKVHISFFFIRSKRISELKLRGVLGEEAEKVQGKEV